MIWFGGSKEYVAAVLAGNEKNGDYFDFNNIDSKYYDCYDGYNDKKYGDAVYEVTQFNNGNSTENLYDRYNEHSAFLFNGCPCLSRGGTAYSTSDCSILVFDRSNGWDKDRYYGFRPCVVNSY